MKLLIVGDSFAADWTAKHPGCQGWPNLLSDTDNVTNIAQAGCSEYRIYQQLKSQNLNDYDGVIISHTSPYRLYVPAHPVHKNDVLHANSDLIYEDVREHKLASLIEYFEKYFDLEYAEFVHTLIGKEIDSLTKNVFSLHLWHVPGNLPCEPKYKLDCTTIWKNNPGLINHYSDKGNKIIYNSVRQQLALASST